MYLRTYSTLEKCKLAASICFLKIATSADNSESNFSSSVLISCSLLHSAAVFWVLEKLTHYSIVVPKISISKLLPLLNGLAQQFLFLPILFLHHFSVLFKVTHRNSLELVIHLLLINCPYCCYVGFFWEFFLGQD